MKGRLEACGVIENREVMTADKNMDLKRPFFANVEVEY
jgi:hypothetical protein